MPTKTTTRTLTKEDKASVLKIIKGARHTYGEGIRHAKTPEEREFYFAQVAEADRLILLFEPAGKIGYWEDLNENEEDDDDADAN
jgi:hypothetical protein